MRVYTDRLLTSYLKHKKTSLRLYFYALLIIISNEQLLFPDGSTVCRKMFLQAAFSHSRLLYLNPNPRHMPFIYCLCRLASASRDEGLGGNTAFFFENKKENKSLVWSSMFGSQPKFEEKGFIETH